MDELRADNIREDFKIIHKNYCDFFKIFKNEYLDNIESLEDEEYVKMRTWLKEYSRMMKIIKNHIIGFKNEGHSEKLPDEDMLIKQAMTILMMLKDFGLES